MENSVPFKEGIFKQNSGGGVLIANKCDSCGRIYFPKAIFCFDCLGEKMVDMELSTKGKLYSYTFGRMPASHFQPPYAVGLIDMPEGVRVFAPLKIFEEKPFKIGMEMAMIIDEYWQESDKHVIGYKFKPL